MKNLTTEIINDFIERQLNHWQEAKINFDRLLEIQRKPLELGSLSAHAQLNPARIRSTGAAVDPASIAARPCFLCAANRPEEQIAVDWPMKGWELLVNPFPILPVHFTIVSADHRPQAEIPLEMAAMAEMAPSLAIFYNGARAGASAPDHAHCQAMLKSELPLISLIESLHPADAPGWKCSEEFEADLPFHFMSAVISPDFQGMSALAKVSDAFGVDIQTGKPDRGLVNAFFWICSESGRLRIAIIPRKAHRPSLYSLPEGERFMISPGAVDMAGLIIVPRREDFERLSPGTASQIYAETAFAGSLPEIIKSHFLKD